ncbi:MAG: hypothetical protein R6X32_17555 [Chloroflexota bacterium]
MSRRPASRGKCVYCDKSYTRWGMTRHLQNCEERKTAVAQRSSRAVNLYHLLVADAWGGYYWLHLDVPGQTTLEELDDYLRSIWLECCGHLSAFDIGEVSYTQLFDDGMAWREERSMDVRLDKVLAAGMEIPYQYDFGTTSELVIKVAAVTKGRATDTPIVLMARNDTPDITCAVCDKPAEYICVECEWEVDHPFYCDNCLIEHAHGDEMGLSVVNSPRMGMCGYDGPAEPPY